MERPKTPLTILTNDPSITAWGWAVLNTDGKILECGCIKTEPHHKKLKTRKGDDDMRRITEINTWLLAKIAFYNVKYILAELPHGSQSASAAKALGMVSAQLQTIADALQIGIEWYSEGDSKMNALGKRTAEKQEMITAMDKTYNVPWSGIQFRDEAVADALAIHYVASRESSALKLFKNQ